MSLTSLLTAMQQSVSNGRVLWKRHALERMMERGISRNSVKQVILEGVIIDQYPEDYPMPSMLMAIMKPTPLHVVIAWNKETAECHVVTAYQPDLIHFEADLITRRKT